MVYVNQFMSVILWGVAGFSIFLMLLNRVLILARDSRTKKPTIYLAFALFIGVGSWLGYLLAGSPWVAVPVVLLLLILLGELRRLWIRKSCAGSLPIGTTPHHIQLASPVTTTDIVTHRYEVPLSKWRGVPLRIVHLTDFHVNAAFPVDYYRQVISLAEEARPDIAVFTGDFITTADALPELQDIFRPIAKHKTYAVLGNHDHWAAPEATGEALRDAGLHLLCDDTDTISVDGNTINIAGHDYPWGERQKHVSPQPGDALNIVLSHTADNIYRVSRTSADLMFCGHYHAGQIRAPFVGPIVVPSIYGRRFDHGHFVVHDTHLFVASGVGAAAPPVRIYCQPDIFVVDVIAETEKREAS